jgi:hypothetical protein
VQKSTSGRANERLPEAVRLLSRPIANANQSAVLLISRAGDNTRPLRIPVIDVAAIIGTAALDGDSESLLVTQRATSSRSFRRSREPKPDSESCCENGSD